MAWVLVYLAFIGSAIVYAKSYISTYEKSKLPSGHIELKLNKIEYQLGETIKFEVINHFPTDIYVLNQCPSEPLNVFKWENEEWIQLHDKVTDKNSDCYNEPRNILIKSERTRVYDFDEWTNLFTKPGVYRVAMTIQGYDDIPFQDFKILEPAKVIELDQSGNVKKVTAPTIAPATTPTELTKPSTKLDDHHEEEEDDEYEDEEHEDDDEYEDD